MDLHVYRGVYGWTYTEESMDGPIQRSLWMDLYRGVYGWTYTDESVDGPIQRSHIGGEAVNMTALTNPTPTHVWHLCLVKNGSIIFPTK